MSSTDNLLKATLNRLGARFGQKLISSIAEIAVKAKEAPERLRNEWEAFQEEVIAEANRLDKESGEEIQNTKKESKNREPQTPQEKIDRIRAKVAELSNKLEDTN